MLRCEDNSLYTGITTDVNRRFSEHKSGKGAKYTKSHKPIKIESVWEVSSKADASKLEYRIKQCTKSEKEDLIRNQTDVFSLIVDSAEISAKRITIK